MKCILPYSVSKEQYQNFQLLLFVLHSYKVIHKFTPFYDQKRNCYYWLHFQLRANSGTGFRLRKHAALQGPRLSGGQGVHDGLQQRQIAPPRWADLRSGEKRRSQDHLPLRRRRQARFPGLCLSESADMAARSGRTLTDDRLPSMIRGIRNQIVKLWQKKI